MNNLEEISNFQSTYGRRELSYLSTIPELLNACECSKNLMIGIYLIEKDQFLYCNKLLKAIVGENYHCLCEEGWDFWFSLVNEMDAYRMKDRISYFFTIPYPQKPLILRYHITNFYGHEMCLKHEIVIHKLEKCTLALNYIFDVSGKERIEQCFTNHELSNKTCFSNKLNRTISSREKEVLRLIGDGYSSKQIADMLFISNHTAISHRKNLIEKFQVKNTAQLIKKASKVMEL